MPGKQKEETVQASNSGGGSFIANANELATLATTRGRKATDSKYLAEVKHALDNPTVFEGDKVVKGEVHGIKCTEFRKAAWIGPELRKAAKQLGIPDRITVRDRSANTSAEHPHGFVLYWVKPEDAKAESESE